MWVELKFSQNGCRMNTTHTDGSHMQWKDGLFSQQFYKHIFYNEHKLNQLSPTPNSTAGQAEGVNREGPRDTVERLQRH